MNPQKYEPIPGRSVQLDEIDWVDFPGPLSQGGIRWKLLNVAPELGFLGSHIRLSERFVFCEPRSCRPGGIFPDQRPHGSQGGLGRRRHKCKSARLRLRGLPGFSWVDKLS